MQAINHKQSIFFIKILLLCSLFLFAQSAFAATLSLSPSTGVYTAGQTFTARVVVNTSGTSINAADGTLSFNPNELSVVGVSKGSIFNLWTAEPSFSNSSGNISFSGGSPAGYKGSAGTVINITFRTKNAGSPKVSFSNGSVLAADGLGTNVLTSMSGGSYTIAAADVTPEPETIEYIAPANTPSAPTIKSETHSDPAKWYKEKTATLSWSVATDVVAVRTLLDGNSGTVPTKVYDTPISSITIDDLDEGVQYFHIQFKNDEGWGRVTHYRLAVDTEKPDAFTISLSENADLSSPNQTLYFETKDKASEVRRFMVQLDGAEPYEYIDETGSSTMLLTNLTPGHHSLIIEAFDEAGNSLVNTFSFAILSFDRPEFTDYPSEINEEVIPVIKGITRPNAEVVVTVKKLGLSVSSNDSKKTYTVVSAEDGVFTFIPDGKLSLGVYELTAVATDKHGAQSDVSESIRIAVQQPGYVRIGTLAVSVLSVLIPLLALVILLVIGFWLLFVKLRSFRSSVSKEASEALTILAKEFDNLERNLEEQKAYLENTRKTKKLTKAESEVIENIASALKTSRTKVRKEIADVEDIVD